MMVTNTMMMMMEKENWKKKLNKYIALNAYTLHTYVYKLSAQQRYNWALKHSTHWAKNRFIRMCIPSIMKTPIVYFFLFFFFFFSFTLKICWAVNGTDYPLITAFVLALSFEWRILSCLRCNRMKVNKMYLFISLHYGKIHR